MTEWDNLTKRFSALERSMNNRIEKAKHHIAEVENCMTLLDSIRVHVIKELRTYDEVFSKSGKYGLSTSCERKRTKLMHMLDYLHDIKLAMRNLPAISKLLELARMSPEEYNAHFAIAESKG